MAARARRTGRGNSAQRRGQLDCRGSLQQNGAARTQDADCWRNTASGWRESLLMRSVHMTTADSRTWTRSLSCRSPPPPGLLPDPFSIAGTASYVCPFVWPIATSTALSMRW